MVATSIFEQRRARAAGLGIVFRVCAPALCASSIRAISSCPLTYSLSTLSCPCPSFSPHLTPVWLCSHCFPVPFSHPSTLVSSARHLYMMVLVECKAPPPPDLSPRLVSIVPLFCFSWPSTFRTRLFPQDNCFAENSNFCEMVLDQRGRYSGFMNQLFIFVSFISYFIVSLRIVHIVVCCSQNESYTLPSKPCSSKRLTCASVIYL